MTFLRALGDGIRRYVAALAGAVRRNPVRAFGAVRSLILVLLAFWPGLLTMDQQLAILGLVAVFLGIDETVRANVTPTVNPTVDAGTYVNVKEPSGVVSIRHV